MIKAFSKTLFVFLALSIFVSSITFANSLILGSTLKSGALSFAASEGASQIGGLYHGGDIGKPAQLALHGGLGAGIAALDGGDPLAGAIGAVTGELTAEAFGNPNNKAQTVALASLAGGLSAAVIGRSGDVTIAANAAGNAAEHNALFLLPAIPPAVAWATGAIAGGTVGFAIVGDGDVVQGMEQTGENAGKIIAYGVGKGYEYYPQTTENTLYALSLPGQAVVGGIDYVGGTGTAHNWYQGYDAWMTDTIGLNANARAGLGVVGAVALGGIGIGKPSLNGDLRISSNVYARTELPISTVKTLEYQPTSGAILKTTEGKTTTILGSYQRDTAKIIQEARIQKSTNFGNRTNDFNLLNTPDDLYVSPKQFWTEYNEPWLYNAIKRNDKIILATEPVFGRGQSVLMRVNSSTGKVELTGFGREYLYLKQSGYKYNPTTKEMVITK